MAAHRSRRWPRGQRVLLTVAARVTAVFLTPPRPRTPHADASRAAGTWSEGSDGSTYSAPSDASKWAAERGGWGNGTHERQYRINGRDPSALDCGGHLVITARKRSDVRLRRGTGACRCTCDRLNTSGTFTRSCGRVEARSKVPRGHGSWPAVGTWGDTRGAAAPRWAPTWTRDLTGVTADTCPAAQDNAPANAPVNTPGLQMGSRTGRAGHQRTAD